MARAKYIGDSQIPKPGSVGLVEVAHGHGDPDSAEYEAFLFTPDGDENSYYVGRDDLEAVVPDFSDTTA